VGILPLLYEGERCLFKGRWENNAEFGMQFAVESFEREFPTDAESIYRYLASGVVKKIGPVIARRIVDRFGDETLNVMANNPMWLCEIRGISRKAAEVIGEDYREKFELHKVMIYCNSLFGADMAAKICNKYGAVAIQIIENNPYCLCEEFRGISFGVADKIALQHGFRTTSDERLEAGICYYLQYSMSEHGHCYIPKKIFIPLAVTRLFGELVFEEADSMGLQIERCLSNLSAIGKVIQFKIDETECIALKYLFECEKYISDKLLLLNEYQRPYRISGIDDEIERLEALNNCEYAEEQKNAIRTAVTSGVTVVTGGPGTGKTTVIKAIISIFNSLKISFILGAPTGRAAKRMSEASGYNAKTIHRLLQPEYDEDGKLKFSKNERDPLSAKAIIIELN
jgi:exodeoxyribonuclease V alpha subunit